MEEQPIIIRDPSSASKKEVALLLKQLIGSVRTVVSETRDKLKVEINEGDVSNENKVKALEIDLRGSIKDLKSLIKESAKEGQDKAYKQLNAEVYKLERLISEVPQFNPSQLEAKFEAVIADLESSTFDYIEECMAPTKTRDSLETLVGDDRLDVTAIKGIDEKDAKLSKDILDRAIGILDQRTSFLINKSGVRSVVAGSNITVTGDPSNPTISSTGGGSGYTKETPVGSVDSSNTTFTVTAEPVYVVADGMTYFDGAGYSYAALSITMTTPPVSFIRSFY